MDIVTYHHEFRTAIFTSSLTLGTFLFTMKTFIIQTIKKEIYDQPLYRAKVENASKLSGEQVTYYKPLQFLSKLILYSILMALINALLQVTLGYICHPLAAGLCLATSLFSWSIFSVVLFQVGRNMSDMLDFAEEDARNKASKLLYPHQEK